MESTTLQTPGIDQLEESILGVFAEVTRYPKEILDTEAGLEEDLGIDSVKLGEIFSVLREKYNLPEQMGIQPEQLKSIKSITAALHEYMSNGYISGGAAAPEAATIPAAAAPAAHVPAANASAPAPVQPVATVPAAASVSTEQLQTEIVAVFADVTRYPAEILDTEASLEEDLGIDSVKLGEIFSVLREKYDLPEKIGLEPEQLKSIAGISTALAQFLSDRDSGAAAPVPAAAAPAAPAVAAPAAPAPPVAQPVQAAHTPVAPVPAPAANGHAANGNGVHDKSKLHNEIVAVFADVTRYPAEILDAEASLEEDLGIDSVKLGEIFSVLREKYDLPEKLGIEPEQLKSISGISDALHTYLSNGQANGHAANGHTANGHAAHVEVPLTPNGNGNGNGHHAAVAQPTIAVPPQHTNGNGATSVGAHSFAALSPELKPFKGKVAFISGSGRGLGKDIATYLADLGCTVIINSFHSRVKGMETVEAIKAKGGSAHHIWGSMANPKQLHDVFDEIEDLYGGLDFFIGNASNGMLAKLEDLTIEHWEKAFRTNIIGLHQSAVRSMKMMRKRGGGKIITMSSPAAHGYVDYFGAMGAVKAAVESMTRSMAIEFAPYNISVNCVSPGPVYGELLNKWPESERLIAKWEENTAYHRLTEARDVSHFIAYLLSEPVKIFTGSVLVMDGGISSQGW